jgi:hypothetical protein
MKNMFNFDFDEMDRSQIKTFSLVAVLVFFIIVTILLIFPIIFYIIVFLGIVIPSYFLYKNYKNK